MIGDLEIWLNSPLHNKNLVDVDKKEKVLLLETTLASPVQYINDYIEKSINRPPSLLSDTHEITRHYKRQRLIEEIVQSEYDYINMLEALQRGYLEVLSSKKYIPITLLNIIVTLILERHRHFYNKVQASVEKRVKRFIQRSNDDPGTSSAYLDSLDFCAEMSNLMSNNVIQVEQYKNYSFLYNQIRDLLVKLRHEGQNTELNELLINIQTYMESKCFFYPYRRDLGFPAMTHVPISRATKYRLFLESMVVLTKDVTEIDFKESKTCKPERYTTMIKASLEKIYRTLEDINKESYDDCKDLKLPAIQERLHFKETKEFIPIEAMGNCFMAGCIATVWVSRKGTLNKPGTLRQTRSFSNLYRNARRIQVKASQFGAFLFKSYLILADIPATTNVHILQSWEVQFSIPLASCRIVDLSQDFESDEAVKGLHSNHKYTLKIMFEHNFQILEVLLVHPNQKDFEIWRQQLDLFINTVNGPYEFNSTYHASSYALDSPSQLGQAITYPQRLVPVEACTQKFFERFKQLPRKDEKRETEFLFLTLESCYHGQLITIETNFVSANWSPNWFRRNNDCNSNSHNSNGNWGSNEKNHQFLKLYKNKKVDFVTNVSKHKRGQVERCMRDVWSDYIPKFGSHIVFLDGQLETDGSCCSLHNIAETTLDDEPTRCNGVLLAHTSASFTTTTELKKNDEGNNANNKNSNISNGSSSVSSGSSSGSNRGSNRGSSSSSDSNRCGSNKTRIVSKRSFLRKVSSKIFKPAEGLKFDKDFVDTYPGFD